MLIRCRARDGHRPAFEEWWRSSHLRDITRIPGIEEVLSSRTPGGTLMAFYIFESAGAVQQALSSPEAAYARGAWGPWMAKLEEMRVEIFAPLVTLPLYQSRS
jgi:hypothetical protein